MPILERPYQTTREYDTNQLPMLPDPNRGVVAANQNENFLQWLFNFREKTIIPLRNTWEGKVYKFETQEWIDSLIGKEAVIMNQNGITWAISLIESYLSPVFITTDFDLQTYNFTMREVSRIIWNSLSLRYKEFGLRKSDIHRVAEEIESKIRAILSGARNDGYRRFFSTQNQYSETVVRNQSRSDTPPSIFSGFKSMFRKEGEEQLNG